MKKIIALILAMVFLLGCLSGCGSASPLDPKAPVTLTMWHNYGGDMQQAMDYLIDRFNSTVGKEQGIVIDVTAISSSSELNKSLAMIVNGDPGAPDMPDIFTGYPKLAIQFGKRGCLPIWTTTSPKTSSPLMLRPSWRKAVCRTAACMCSPLRSPPRFSMSI